MKRILTALACLAIAGTSLAASADRGPGINARQHKQQHRIQQGVRSGELTPREATRVRTEQRAIRAEERRYRADGTLTPGERTDLHHDLNRASGDIYRQKHDAHDRPAVAVRDPGVNRRQHVQRDRIGQGVRAGELTKDEVRGLGQEQRSIRQEERAYKSDGVVTRDERKDLHQDLGQASRNIYAEKHDDEKR